MKVKKKKKQFRIDPKLKKSVIKANRIFTRYSYNNFLKKMHGIQKHSLKGKKKVKKGA